MGVIKKLANITKLETGPGYVLGHSLSQSAVSNIFGSGGTSINVVEEYAGYAWKAINIKATALSNEELFVEREVAGKFQRDPNHEFMTVLAGRPGQRDLSELLSLHKKIKEIHGESFWYYSKEQNRNRPFAIYPLNPANVTVLVANRSVVGYRIQEGSNIVHLDLDEVDHFMDESVTNQFRGYGPMQAAGIALRSNRYTTTYVNNFLENNAIPAGVIVAKEGFSDDKDWRLFKKAWAEKHSGVANAGKTGFVKAASLEFVKTGLSLGDVDFSKLRESSRDEIMVMFGISKPMFAIFDDINRASAITARTLFAEAHTEPELRALARKLTRRVKEWYGPQYRIGFTNPIPEDAEEKLKVYDRGVGRWLTVNEARAAYGLDPIAGGDVLNPAIAPPATPKSIGKVTIRTKNNKAEFSYEMKESFRSEMEDVQLKYESQVLQTANKVLSDQKERVLDQLKPKKLVDARFDADQEAKELSDNLISIFIGLAAEQGTLAAQFAGNPQSTFTLSAVMEKYIADSVAKAALSFTKETQEKIAEALATGLNEGESIGAIGRRINSIYDDVLGVKNPGYRIERLVRTEVIKTSNEVTEAAYKESGVVRKKEWFANPGRCEFCASLNGSIVSLGATYLPKGATIEGINGGTRVNSYEDVKHPPIHPACRCTLIPVIED